MREIEDDFRKAGIAVRFVVIGSPEEAAEFCARFGDPRNCLSDRQKTTYKAMGFEEFNLLMLLRDSELRQRRRQNRAAGFRQNWRATRLRDSAQLPGAAVIDADGALRWIYRGRHPGDLPPMSQMLAVARGLLGSG